MDEVEVRRRLKMFGLQVTQFMGRRRQLKDQAASAIEGEDRTTVAAVLASLMTDTSELPPVLAGGDEPGPGGGARGVQRYGAAPRASGPGGDAPDLR